MENNHFGYMVKIGNELKFELIKVNLWTNASEVINSFSTYEEACNARDEMK
jgi:hypothetical protein